MNKQIPFVFSLCGVLTILLLGVSNYANADDHDTDIIIDETAMLLSEILTEMKIYNSIQMSSSDTWYQEYNDRYQFKQIQFFHDGTTDRCTWNDKLGINNITQECMLGNPNDTEEYNYIVWYQTNWPDEKTLPIPYSP